MCCTNCSVWPLASDGRLFLLILVEEGKLESSSSLRACWRWWAWHLLTATILRWQLCRSSCQDILCLREHSCTDCWLLTLSPRGSELSGFHWGGGWFCPPYGKPFDGLFLSMIDDDDEIHLQGADKLISIYFLFVLSPLITIDISKSKGVTFKPLPVRKVIHVL